MTKGVLLPWPGPAQAPDTLLQVLLQSDGHLFLHFCPYNPSVQSLLQFWPRVPLGHTLKNNVSLRNYLERTPLIFVYIVLNVIPLHPPPSKIKSVQHKFKLKQENENFLKHTYRFVMLTMFNRPHISLPTQIRVHGSIP